MKVVVLNVYDWKAESAYESLIVTIALSETLRNGF